MDSTTPSPPPPNNSHPTSSSHLTQLDQKFRLQDRPTSTNTTSDSSPDFTMASRTSYRSKPKPPPTLLQPTKRAQVTDEDGWTHVIQKRVTSAAKKLKSKSKQSLTSEASTGQASSHTPSASQSSSTPLTGSNKHRSPRPRTDSDAMYYADMAVDQIKAEYRYFKAEWSETEACAKLKEMFSRDGPWAFMKHGADPDIFQRTEEEVYGQEKKISIWRPRCKVDNVVCLGLGSLKSEYNFDRRRHHLQLLALETIRAALDALYENETPMPMAFQDPEFVESDHEFLESLGYKVVEHPVATDQLVNKRSLTYAIHCYPDIYDQIFHAPNGPPALHIGNDVNSWNLQTEGPPPKEGEYHNNTKVDVAQLAFGCEAFSFPQLEDAFHDTIAYWRQKGYRTKGM